MAYVAHHTDFHVSAANLSAPAAAPRRSFFRFLYDAVFLARERQAQRDIDHVVSWRDGGFNDSFEREIAERFYSGDQGFRR